MKNRSRILGFAAGAALALGAVGLQGATFQLPQLGFVSGGATIPLDSNYANGAQPQTGIVTANQLAAFDASLPLNVNYLIGGDAGQNLWQRATTGASQTTTVAYGGPDRWAYWSGTNTAITLTRDSTAAALPAGYQYDFRLQRTASQTGLVQICIAQEVETGSAFSLAGQTVEVDFHAYTGANFSAAGAAMTAYVITGTGTDDGMQKLAFGLNAGGGGSSGWTGQANATAAVISLGAVSTAGRYAAFAAVPATATEVGVALCYTPVGTAGTTDAVYFSGVQLIRSPQLASFVSATVGYSCSLSSGGTAQAIVATPAPNCTAFARRPLTLESALQYRFYYQLTETAAITPVAPCSAVDTTHTNCLVQFPVNMRIAPTVTYVAGFASPTSTTQATLGNCSALANAATVTSTVANPLNVLVNCTASTIPAAGIASFLYSNNGSGTIKATAEL